MNKKLAGTREIESLAKAIRTRELNHIASFADMTNRYIDIVMKRDSDSRLKWSVLSYLIVRGGKLWPTELARLMFRSKHSITLVIDELEKQGLVVRQRARNDRRHISIRITEAGLDDFKKALNRAEQTWQPVISCLNKDERATLIDLMRRARQEMIKYISEKIDATD